MSLEKSVERHPSGLRVHITKESPGKSVQRSEIRHFFSLNYVYCFYGNKYNFHTLWIQTRRALMGLNRKNPNLLDGWIERVFKSEFRLPPPWGWKTLHISRWIRGKTLAAVWVLLCRVYYFLVHTERTDGTRVRSCFRGDD